MSAWQRRRLCRASVMRGWYVILSWLSAKAVAAAEAADSDELRGGGYGGREAGGAASKSWETLKISGGGSLGHDARSEEDLVGPR